MKYKGKKVQGKNTEIIAIPRASGNLIFIAEAVPDWNDFNKYCPEPQPPTKLKPGGITTVNENDPLYRKKIEEYNTLRTHWLVIKSLQVTEDLEWETVDFTKSETWPNYEKELKDSDFTPLEIGRIVRGVMVANAIDDAMIEAAKSDFLATQGEQGK